MLVKITHTDAFTLSGADPEDVFPVMLGHEGGVEVKEGLVLDGTTRFTKASRFVTIWVIPRLVNISLWRSLSSKINPEANHEELGFEFYWIAVHHNIKDLCQLCYVDFGIGRVRGADPFIVRALRHQANNHEQDVADLQHYFGAEQPKSVNALLGTGTNVPLYILGASVSSAYYAAEKGLPYAFASHFMPMQQKEALQIYRQNFKPSAYCQQPYVIFC